MSNQGRQGDAHLPAPYHDVASNGCNVMKGASRHARGVWPLWPCCTEASLPVIDCIDIEGALFRSDERLRAGKRHTVLAGEERLTGPEMVNQGKQRARALTATTGAQCKWITTKCSMRKLRSMTASSRCHPERRALRNSALSTEDSDASR